MISLYGGFIFSPSVMNKYVLMRILSRGKPAANRAIIIGHQNRHAKYFAARVPHIAHAAGREICFSWPPIMQIFADRWRRRIKHTYHVAAHLIGHGFFRLKISGDYASRCFGAGLRNVNIMMAPFRLPSSGENALAFDCFTPVLPGQKSRAIEVSPVNIRWPSNRRPTPSVSRPAPRPFFSKPRRWPLLDAATAALYGTPSDTRRPKP